MFFFRCFDLVLKPLGLALSVIKASKVSKKSLKQYNKKHLSSQCEKKACLKAKAHWQELEIGPVSRPYHLFFF